MGCVFRNAMSTGRLLRESSSCLSRMTMAISAAAGSPPLPPVGEVEVEDEEVASLAVSIQSCRISTMPSAISCSVNSIRKSSQWVSEWGESASGDDAADRGIASFMFKERGIDLRNQ
jgi:hypothetical protein